MNHYPEVFTQALETVFEFSQFVDYLPAVPPDPGILQTKVISETTAFSHFIISPKIINNMHCLITYTMWGFVLCNMSSGLFLIGSLKTKQKQIIWEITCKKLFFFILT